MATTSDSIAMAVKIYIFLSNILLLQQCSIDVNTDALQKEYVGQKKQVSEVMAGTGASEVSRVKILGGTHPQGCTGWTLA